MTDKDDEMPAAQDPDVVPEGGEPDDPVEGPRDDAAQDNPDTGEIPSTHMPGVRSFDL